VIGHRPRRGELPVLRSARTMMSWTLLAAMLVSPLGGNTGRFVCMLGMTQAGPACPRCRGLASADQPGPAIGNNCCRFDEGRSATDARLATAPVDGPAFGQSLQLQTAASFNVPTQSDRDLAARGGLLGVRRTPTSGYRSNFLRL